MRGHREGISPLQLQDTRIFHAYFPVCDWSTPNPLTDFHGIADVLAHEALVVESRREKCEGWDSNPWISTEAGLKPAAFGRSATLAHERIDGSRRSGFRYGRASRTIGDGTGENNRTTEPSDRAHGRETSRRSAENGKSNHDKSDTSIPSDSYGVRRRPNRKNVSSAIPRRGNQAIISRKTR